MRELERMIESVRKLLPELFFTIGILVILCAGLGTWLFCMPCRIEADCRGRDIDVKQMQIWEEQAKDGSYGILAMAGWRTERMQTVSSVSTGRRALTMVTGVCGDAALVYPAKILAGNYALPATDDEKLQNGKNGRIQRSGCILTGELSDELFGSLDTAGELVKTEDGILVITGVIDKDGKQLLKPVSEGDLEYAAFRVPRRWQAEEKVWELCGR